ncbi:hypothetical protein TRAPUB_7628 [Trametes pubescens]|uniref:MYND-type domain-containing protein n=1 Tax=Trametes pubescens TaxID=154538 RepID=A0A1M2V302_TRAPU|nr:hypothetical protein TRAPUB_7628 [Trametes pubescens]
MDETHANTVPASEEKEPSVNDLAFERIRRIWDNKRKEEHVAKTHCSYCDKRGSQRKPLQTCSHCKAARYCDTDCQRADFRAGHKDECKGFARLPNTMAFQYEPNPEERFPHHPIFAHAHADDVGCVGTR